MIGIGCVAALRCDVQVSVLINRRDMRGFVIFVFARCRALLVGGVIDAQV